MLSAAHMNAAHDNDDVDDDYHEAYQILFCMFANLIKSTMHRLFFCIVLKSLFLNLLK